MKLQNHFVSPRVVAEVGSACYEVTVGEKRETTTALASFNAVGDYMPLFVFFKAKRLKAECLYQAPPNTDNGWINSELILDWGRQFVKNLPKATSGWTQNPCLQHFLKLMKENNVHVMCYPAHTTHCLQPADKSLFKSLKNSWNEEGRRFIRETGGRKLRKVEFFTGFSQAWKKAATVEIAQNGFRGTGMYLINKDYINPDVYEPSKTTERAK